MSVSNILNLTQGTVNYGRISDNFLPSAQLIPRITNIASLYSVGPLDNKNIPVGNVGQTIADQVAPVPFVEANRISNTPYSGNSIQLPIMLEGPFDSQSVTFNTNLMFDQLQVTITPTTYANYVAPSSIKIALYIEYFGPNPNGTTPGTIITGKSWNINDPPLVYNIPVTSALLTIPSNTTQYNVMCSGSVINNESISITTSNAPLFALGSYCLVYAYIMPVPGATTAVAIFGQNNLNARVESYFTA